MDHGSDSLIVPPWERESGRLISTDAHGGELRIHKDEGTGLWHINRWSPWAAPPLAPVKPQRWRCSVVWGLTALELVEVGEAMQSEIRTPEEAP